MLTTWPGLHSTAGRLGKVTYSDPGAYIPNGNDANFPSLPLSLPPLPVGLGADPQWQGKIEIEVGFGAFWRIFVSKRQLSSVSLFVNKN